MIPLTGLILHIVDYLNFSFILLRICTMCMDRSSAMLYKAKMYCFD